MNPSNSENTIHRTSRRQFTRQLAITAAAPLALGATSTRAQPPAAGQAPPATDPLAAAAEALTGIVKSRHGQNLTDDQVKQIQRSILGNLRSGERLKQFKLQNADEPDFAFTPDATTGE
jgi:hypothetical protein